MWQDMNPMGMASFVNSWEGRVVEGRFPLLERLDGTDHRASYLTALKGMQEAVIHLILVGDAEADSAAAQWEFARTLAHPHLEKILASGRCSIDGEEFLYVVSERTSTNLARTIESGVVAEDRAKEIFGPIVDALIYLHGNGVIHGFLKPASIHFAGTRPLLSITDLLIAGAGKRKISTPGNYDAPELWQGQASVAADTWSLGMTMWEAMTAAPPSWDLWHGEEPEVPASLASPFREIIRGCLHLDPLRRMTLEAVQTQMGAFVAAENGNANLTVASEAPASVAKVAHVPVETPAEVSVPALAAPAVSRFAEEHEIHAPAPRRIESEEPADDAIFAGTLSRFEDTHLSQSRAVPYTFVVLALIAAGAFFGVRAYKSGTFAKLMQSGVATSAPAKPSAEPPAAEQSATSRPAPEQAQPSQAPPAQEQSAQTPPQESAPTPAQTATSSPQPAAGGTDAQDQATVPPAKQPAVEQQPKESDESARADVPAEERPAHASRTRVLQDGRGQVERRVMPAVSSGARSAMARPVLVLIRVTVNRQGSVSDASYVVPGPGNYFARQAQKAAEGWRFKPPVDHGTAEASVWMLKFNFGRGGTEATATEQPMR